MDGTIDYGGQTNGYYVGANVLIYAQLQKINLNSLYLYTFMYMCTTFGRI